MTPYELKRQVKWRYPRSTFFDRDVLAATGDTMENFGVRTYLHNHTIWELYRKAPVAGGVVLDAFTGEQESFYFRKDNFLRTKYP